MAREDDVALVRSLVGAIPAAALACEPGNLAIRAVNDAATALLSRDSSTLTLSGLSDLAVSGTTIAGDPIEEVFSRVSTRDGSVNEGSVTAEVDVEVDGDTRRLRLRAHATTLAEREWLIAVATDVTPRVRAERGNRSRARTLDAVASTLPMALFRCDARGTISRWNERAGEDTGYDADDLDGRAFADLFDADGRSAVSDGLTRVYRDGAVAECEATLLTRSGEEVPYRLTMGPVTDGESVVGAVVLGEDRTEESVREERLAVLTRVLRHNFRNELNVVTGFSEQARNAVEDPELTEQLDRVVDTAGRLLHLGETARKVERLLAERSEPEPLPLSRVVTSALESLPPRLRESADVDVDVPPGITVLGVDRLPDAIAELVDNAIRHGDADRPSVRVSAAELPSESWVSLVVADDGPGIPPAERAVLTGEETQLKHTSGLGLWYVHWVVTAGGGRLDIAESKDGGSRIELSLRTAEAA
ncbi:PAS domain S-box-containing protein [Halorubrum aquaticum]|uniref:histidine kinase n=1 Tax=Halorubrum aquaticum TaxID=387340 RepID=A0A1I3AUE3_9EURY|nr:PAS domain-containing sensor histidine kinase [Halorubrum aquaticum]SFH53707.1 PAS domain S-box-containing protein [Halorubrum aquaticum]